MNRAFAAPHPISTPTVLKRARLLAQEALTRGISTPFLLMDADEMERCLARFRRHLPFLQLHYAMKANPAPEVLRFFARRGLAFDVASAGEIEILAKIGVSGKRMILSNPVKDARTLEALFRHRVAACVVDTIQGLDRLAATRDAGGYLYSPRVFVRLQVESEDVEVDLNTKFGCPEAEAITLLRKAQEMGFVPLGVSFHVGTQCYRVANYRAGLAKALRVVERARKQYAICCEVINVGGGFCDPTIAEREGVDLERFYAACAEACQPILAAGYTLMAEPGRALVSSAGHLITRVLEIARRGGQRWVYLDDGIYGAFSCQTYEKTAYSFHPIEESLLEREAGSCVVAGPTCDALDVLTSDGLLPDALAPGDILITPGTGAYSLSTACAFNGFSPPACHIAGEDTSCTNAAVVGVVARPLSNPGISIAAGSV